MIERGMSGPEIDALIANLPPEIRPVVELVVGVLREQNARQSEQNDKLLAEIAELRRLLFGRKSEAMPDARRTARSRAQSTKSAEEREQERQDARKANREAREELPVVEETLDVDDAARVCPCCGSTALTPLGEGLVTSQIEYVPAHLVCKRITRARYACACGKGIVTAPAPAQVSEGCEYGPGLHAHVVVSKCADALPFHRQAQQFARHGVPMSRSTLCSLFHRCAESLDAVYQRLVEEVAGASHVSADETPLPVLAEGGCKRGYVWTFVTDRAVVFTYSPSRGGQTPLRVLGDSDGVLQADAYSGYNAVTTPAGRVRAGCWAHARRMFFRALETAPEAAGEAMDQIARLYDVEHRAAAQDVVGTRAHAALRAAESAPRIDALFAWLTKERSQHPPKSPMGKAIAYASKQETALRVFLLDPKVALDNNAAERALKPVALGRKNFLFAGHDEGAENLAKLQTLVATCQRHGVNAEDYVRDLLIRVHTHPAKAIDELLPWNWRPPP